MIEIILAGDPVGKGRPRFSRKSGTVYTPKKTASYENRLAWAAQSVMAGRPLLEGALSVSIFAKLTAPMSWSINKRMRALAGEIMPTGRPDGDNLAKICLDSLNKVVWVDDSQVVDLRVSKFYSGQPQLEISISEIEPLTSVF